MKRLDIVFNPYRRKATYCFGAEVIQKGSVGVDSYLDCTSDIVQAVYDKLEEDDIKLVGKCEVYFNGKLWETVDNG